MASWNLDFSYPIWPRLIPQDGQFTVFLWLRIVYSRCLLPTYSCFFNNLCEGTEEWLPHFNPITLMQNPKDTLRTRLYQATKEPHERVERSFGFAAGITREAYARFLFSLHRARLCFAPDLEVFETKSGIRTFNAEMVEALENDLEQMGISVTPYHRSAPTMDNQGYSRLAGIHYVFAGSAAGSRFLMNMINISALEIPVDYISRMDRKSRTQLRELEALLKDEALEERELVQGAQDAFDFIHDQSTDAVIGRNTKF